MEIKIVEESLGVSIDYLGQRFVMDKALKVNISKEKKF